MKKSWILLVFMTLSCSNAFQGTQSTESDAALYEDAKKLTNQSKYTEALAKYAKLGSAYKSQTEVLENWAGAYAGNCGLDFIQYFNGLSTATVGSTTMFKYLASAWVGKVIDPTSCTEAEKKIKEIWTRETPTASQQLFIAILSMVKMGTYVRNKSDRDESGGLGDGTTDSSFDACVATPTISQLTDDEIKEIVTGFSLFLFNVTGFAASLSGSLSSSISTINTICSALPAADNPCNTTEATGVTATMVTAMRNMLASNTIGIGSCATYPAVPCCP